MGIIQLPGTTGAVNDAMVPHWLRQARGWWLISRSKDCRRRFRGMVLSAINAEIVEPVPLGEAVEPVLLRNFLSGVVLRRANGHGLQLGQRGAAGGCIPGAVLLDQLLEQVRPFQDNAT